MKRFLEAATHLSQAYMNLLRKMPFGQKLDSIPLNHKIFFKAKRNPNAEKGPQPVVFTPEQEEALRLFMIAQLNEIKNAQPMNDEEREWLIAQDQNELNAHEEAVYDYEADLDAAQYEQMQDYLSDEHAKRVLTASTNSISPVRALEEPELSPAATPVFFSPSVTSSTTTTTTASTTSASQDAANTSAPSSSPAVTFTTHSLRPLQMTDEQRNLLRERMKQEAHAAAQRVFDQATGAVAQQELPAPRGRNKRKKQAI